MTSFLFATCCPRCDKQVTSDRCATDIHDGRTPVIPDQMLSMVEFTCVDCRITISFPDRVPEWESIDDDGEVA